MAKGNESTTKFKADISDLKAGMQEAARQVRLANSEFKAATAGMDNWGKSADGLSAKVKQLDSVLDAQKKQLASLEQQYALTAKEQGENSKGAQELMIKINNQKAAIGKTEAQLNSYSAKLEDVKNSAGDFADGTNKVVTASDKLKNTISEQESELSRLKGAYTNVALEQGESSDEAQRLAKEIGQLSSELQENKSKLSDAEGAADGFDNSLNNVGDAAEESAGGFTVMKGALASLVADGIKAAAEAFKELITASSEANANFQAQTGASTAEMEEFSESIENLYKQNFGESMEDVADAMAEVKKQTGEIDPSKLEDMTKSAITLRDTFGYELNESMRAVKMLMDQFGLSADEAFNFVVKGAQEGLDKNGDLLDTINEYGVHYKQMGYSADEFYNSLKNGSNAGTFSVDKLGDAMKEFGIRAKDTSTTTTDGFVMLGYKATASADQIAKTKDEISKLEKNLKYAKMEQEGFNDKTSELTKMKNADKIKEYSESLEGAKLKLSEMTSESGKSGKSISELQTKFAKGGTSAKEATAEVLQALYSMENPVKQNAAGVALFGTMWEDLGADGVKALMDVSGEAVTTGDSMKQLTDVKYSDIGSQFAEIGRSIKVELLQPLVNQVLPGVQSFLSAVLTNIPAVKKAFADGLNTLKEWSPVIGGIGAAIATYFVVTKIMAFITAIKSGTLALQLMTAAQTALNVVMAMNPVGLVIAAIAGLVAAFVILWNKSETFRNFWIGLWDGIKGAVGPVIDAIVIFFTETIPNVFTGVIDWIKSNWKNLLLILVNPFAGLFKYFYENNSKFKEFVDNAINAIKELPGKVWQWLTQTITKVALWTVNMANKAKETGTKFLSNIVTFFTKLPERIGYFIGYALASVVKWAIDMAAKAKETGTKFLSNIISFFTQLPGKVWNFLVTTVTKVAAWVINMNAKAKDAGSKFLSGVITFITQLPGKVWTFLSSTIVKAATFAIDMRNKGIAAAKNLVNSIINGVKSLPGKMVGIGKNIVDGVWQGIQGAAGSFKDKVTGFFNGIVDGAKDALGIHSPSRVFKKQIGANIVEGINAGIIVNAPKVVKSLNKLAKKMVSTMKKANGNYESVGAKAIASFNKGVDSMVKSSAKSVTKLVNNQVSTLTKKNKKMKSTYQKAGKEVIEAYTKAIEKATEKAKNTLAKKLDKIAETTQEKYDKIKDLQSAMTDKLAEYGDLYTIDDNGKLTLNNIQKDINTMRKYENDLKKLKGKISDDLMSEITNNMDVDDAVAYMNALLNMSEQELKHYNDLYSTKLKLAKNISKRFYADKLKEIQDEYTSKLQAAFKEAKATIAQAGEDAVNGFVQGMSKSMKKNDKAIKKIAESVVNTMKKTLKIHSPSKVFESLGMYSGEGYQIGLTKSMNQAKSSLSNMLGTTTAQVKKGLGASNSSTTNNYNFYQTNNSPKALSRLEIYRQTKNQLAFAKGV